MYAGAPVVVAAKEAVAEEAKGTRTHTSGSTRNATTERRRSFLLAPRGTPTTTSESGECTIMTAK
ncbi:hypothetical protein MMC14_000963 [Varicellaria rhodocarpa]|nr:hypothetical protein [Varicellaria rhodocarpa]